MSSRLPSSKPYPDRVLLDTGYFFNTGAICGSVYSFVRGTLKSPGGSRFSGGIQTMCMNAPRIAGYVGAWSGLTTAFECGLVFVVTTFLKRRAGFWAASRYASFAGTVTVCCVLDNIMDDRFANRNPQKIVLKDQDPSTIYK